jgi:hypothetical protein
MQLHTRTLLAIAALIAASMAAGAPDQDLQGEYGTETQLRVPALDSLHVVIFKLWHDAWPKKDVTTLTAVLPDIEQRVGRVSAATLPGILRDKQTAWDKGVAKLKAAAADYRSAVEAKNEQQLLNAAERLHFHYELLVRSIRPPLKEMADFHSILYLLYHYHTPAFSLDKIVASTTELKSRMTALNAVILPDRLKKRQDTFSSARAKLSASVDSLISIIASSDKERITSAVENVHANYQTLERTVE